MPSANTVAAGSTAIFNLPLGLTYHSLSLFYREESGEDPARDAAKADIAADIDEIRLKIDGVVKQEYSAAQLHAINGFYGHVVDVAGVLPILFSRPWLRLAQSEDNFAWGTANGSVQSFTVEVDLNASAEPTSLELYAEQGAPSPLGDHIEIKRFPRSVSGAGEFEISDLPRSTRYAVFANHLTTESISNVIVEANQRRLIEGGKAILNSQYQRNGGRPRQWQTGYFHLDHGALNRLAGALPMALEDYRLKLTMTGAASFNVIQERVVSRQVAA